MYRLGEENVCGVWVCAGRGGGKQEGYVFCSDVNVICIMDFFKFFLIQYVRLLL